MNERIKLLAEQAEIEFTYDPTETPMRAFVECWADDLEKFAELIVKECMAVATKQRKPANLNYNPGERFAEDLRQHFGVKE